MAKRVVLAYSGGLDTSVAVKWIQEEWGAEVVALAVDVGQTADDDWDVDQASARSPPARSRPRSSTRAEFADDYLVPAIHANALYEGKYPLVSALSRPVIAQATWCGAARVRRRRGRARLHRQGQRPGAVRGVGAGARRPTSRCSRRCGMWGFTREDSIDYAARTTSRSRCARTTRTRSTRTSGVGPSSAA